MSSRPHSPATEQPSTQPSFEAEYARLNEQQQQAVDTIEGPVMVVAGPGSGKTQVVALRVANILRRTQMRPSNILCLTFSLSGATAMRNRLRWLIGADAYRVTIETIHGFCNDIIRSHPQVFEEVSALEQISDVQRYRLVNELIDELPAGSSLVHPKDRYARTADILQRIAELKRENIAESHLRSSVETYRVEMEHKSKPGTKVHARNIRDAEKFAEFVGLFARYQQALHERGLYDYEDMIHAVLRALREEDWMLAQLQERYQYVLVDEYQDTNGSQNAVVAALTTYPEGVRQDPNVFVVGDDDQAIYRFQGANVRNMLAFRERFPGCPVITLNVSYRSTQPILDAAMRLIEQNNDRLVRALPDVTKRLLSAAAQTDGPAPQLFRCVSDAVEPFAIAEQVESVIASGVAPTEIAVFTRNNDELFPLHDALQARGIPAQMIGKLDLLRQPCVLECLTLLRAVLSPHDDAAFSAALAARCFGCHAADLGMVWTEQRRRNQERASGEARLSICDVCNSLSTNSIGALKEEKKLEYARDVIVGVSLQLSSMTIVDALEKLLRQSGLLPHDQAHTDARELVALSEFFSHVRQRAHEHSSFDLRQLLSDIEYRQEYAIPLRFAIPHIVDDGVQLMTAHGSKGLEFEVVIIANFREKHWDNKRAPGRLSLPDHLLFGTGDEEGMSLQDERRLAYVAFTRAKKKLLLSCPLRMTRGEKEQDIAPSLFVTEAGPLREEHYDLREPSRANAFVLPTKNIDPSLEAFLRKKLETYELSVTALNRFLEDPQQFLWEDLLALPKAKEPQLAYGTAVHAALQAWATELAAGREMRDKEVIQNFDTALQEKEILTNEMTKNLLHLGRETLQRYYDVRLREQRPIIFGVERRLTGRLGYIPLKGLVDRIDLENVGGSGIHIIDYKTGKPKTERQVREEYNGSLFRQLVFYKLLCEVSPSLVGYEPRSFSLDFVGERDEDPRLLRFEVTSGEANALRDVVRAVWAKVQALDFTPLQ